MHLIGASNMFFTPVVLIAQLNQPGTPRPLGVSTHSHPPSTPAGGDSVDVLYASSYKDCVDLPATVLTQAPIFYNKKINHPRISKYLN